MNFIEAVQQMKKGNHVRLPDWGEDRFFCINNGLIYNTCWCNLDLAFDEPYGISEREFLNTEWEIVRVEEELPKLHTFEEAITALKEGKVIYRKSDKERVYTSHNGQMFYYDLGRDEMLHIVNAFYPDIIANDWIIKKNR